MPVEICSPLAAAQKRLKSIVKLLRPGDLEKMEQVLLASRQVKAAESEVRFEVIHCQLLCRVLLDILINDSLVNATDLSRDVVFIFDVVDIDGSGAIRWEDFIDFVFENTTVERNRPSSNINGHELLNGEELCFHFHPVEISQESAVLSSCENPRQGKNVPKKHRETAKGDTPKL
jgi:hypothetical protein